jgi:hypothetical protein
MTFNPNNWAVISESGVIPSLTLQSGFVVGAPGLYTYQSGTETLATISAANYFAPIANILTVNDLMYIVGSDGESLFVVTSVSETPMSVSISQILLPGYIHGPASSTDTAVVRWNGTTGTLIEDSGVLIDSSNNTVTPGNLTLQGGKSLFFDNPANTFSSSFKEGASSASKVYTWPLIAPAVSGYVMSATTAGVMSWIAPPSSGMTWTDQTTTPATLAPLNGYIADNAGLVTLNMPATVALGSVFAIVGKGAGGWLVQMNTGQVANMGSSPTSSAGSLASTNRYDCIELVCVTANTTFVVRSSMGNITVA